MSDNPLRNLPSVDQLLQNPMIQQLVQQASRSSVVQKVRDTLDEVRQKVTETASEAHVPSPQEIVDRVAGWMKMEEGQELRPVINATGVLLHTGLGRAPLAQIASQEILSLSERYSSLEFDLKTGQRGRRTTAISALLRELTGAEAATVVNNNAAATMLTLAALCQGREVIVSRGQLVEIGGSYRLPEVMEAAGCQLVEVGTTNKTRLQDYEKAITPATAAILRVHPSNYVVCGFTEAPSLKELSDLARKKNIHLIDDIGSGAMLEFGQYGLQDEPTVAHSVQYAGVSLFSGDKLLGGPQSGMIVGNAALVAQITQHPMMRALRVGKLTLSALQATLKLYRDPKLAAEQIPLLRMLQTPVENLRLRAGKIAEQLRSQSAFVNVEVVDSQATLGGGSLPTQELPSVAIRLRPASGSVTKLAEQLRVANPAIVGRIRDEALWLDLKSVAPTEDRLLVEAIAGLPQNETTDTVQED